MVQRCCKVTDNYLHSSSCIYPPRCLVSVRPSSQPVIYWRREALHRSHLHWAVRHAVHYQRGQRDHCRHHNAAVDIRSQSTTGAHCVILWPNIANLTVFCTMLIIFQIHWIHKGILSKGKFLMADQCHGDVEWYWGDFLLPSSGSWLGVSQPKSFVHMSPAENLAAPNEKGEVNLDNCGVILALIYWLGPPLFLLWSS